MNIASLWVVPLLFICENNYHAQSTPQCQNLAGDIYRRAEIFGIETAHSNTWNPEQLFESVSRTVQKVREEQKPFFHRIDTYRLMEHSKGVDSLDTEIMQENFSRGILSEKYLEIIRGVVEQADT